MCYVGHVKTPGLDVHRGRALHNSQKNLRVCNGDYFVGVLLRLTELSGAAWRGFGALCVAATTSP